MKKDEQDTWVRMQHHVPDQLPHLIGFRYKLLLAKTNPKELVPGQPPSLTWLEDRYGHLVEKEFWYDRTVKLASTYKELCEGDVFDLSLGELEQAVGHLVPYTEEEKEYLQLMDNYKKSPLQMDGRPSLEYLRKHHSTPPRDRAHANITKAALDDVLTCPPNSPQYLPDPSDGEDSEEADVNRYVANEFCPIHEGEKMTCLNADEVFGAPVSDPKRFLALQERYKHELMGDQRLEEASKVAARRQLLLENKQVDPNWALPQVKAMSRKLNRLTRRIRQPFGAIPPSEEDDEDDMADDFAAGPVQAMVKRFLKPTKPPTTIKKTPPNPPVR